MPAFLKQSSTNTRSTFCAIWENNLETFEKLFYMTQSGCSIYSHFLKPLQYSRTLAPSAYSNEDYGTPFSIRASKIGP